MRPGMGATILAGLVLLAATAAQADQVRKCSGRDGHHSYVSGACPPGTRQLWVLEVTPEPVAADEPARRLAALEQWQWRQEQLRSRSMGVRYRWRPRPRVDTAARACDKARRRRDEIRDRDWYTVTIDRLRKLDEQVARACR